MLMYPSLNRHHVHVAVESSTILRSVKQKTRAHVQLLHHRAFLSRLIRRYLLIIKTDIFIYQIARRYVSILKDFRNLHVLRVPT